MIPRIPRVIHQIWIGGEPPDAPDPPDPPDSIRRWTDGWRAAHPAWRYHLWSDATLPRLANQSAFDAAESLAQKADIARYELVHQHGGVYIDADYECLGTLDELIAGRESLIVQDTCGVDLAQNGLFALPVGSPVTEACIDAIGRGIDPAEPPNHTTGPYLFTDVVRRFGLVIEPLSILDGIAVHHALASWVRSRRR